MKKIYTLVLCLSFCVLQLSAAVTGDMAVCVNEIVTSGGSNYVWE